MSSGDAPAQPPSMAAPTSIRAELLLMLLRYLKKRQARRPIVIVAMRQRLKLIERIVPLPPRGTRTRSVDADGVPAVQVAVPQSRSDRCILYFHGGGYVFGSAALYRDFLWRIAVAARACVLYFDYRLAPEHPFPAAVEDSIRAYRWLAGRLDHQHIAFAGDSSGGGLAFATLHKLRDEGSALPGAVAALSPWTDLALSGQSLQSNAEADVMLNVTSVPMLAGHYLAGADPCHPYASPLYGDPSGWPPALIQVGSDEILRDDAVRMADKLKAAGCEIEIEVWPRMPHAWQLYARIIPEGRNAIARIGMFLDRRL
jgi:epsilon-lactone hydrolase